MIIENRWFAFMAPRRADLSGRPLGFLLVWLGGAGRINIEEMRRTNPCARWERYGREFGIYIPLVFFSGELSEIDPLEAVQLIDRDADDIPHDWRGWPDGYRQACEGAVARALAERPGMKIIRDKSFCDRRIDLAGRPLQLYREIVLAPA